MKVSVLLFAMMRDAAGVDRLDIDLPEGAAAGDVVELVVQRFPTLRPFCGKLVVAVNLEYVPLSHLVKAGDQIAMIPPVSGG